MIFANIPNGMSLFVDANTFVYHFAPDPVLGPPSQQFFDRVDRQEILAFTSTHELSDAAHRLMTIEAMARFGWKAAGIAQHACGAIRPRSKSSASSAPLWKASKFPR